jgi:YHS domain-containing protein
MTQLVRVALLISAGCCAQLIAAGANDAGAGRIEQDKKLLAPVKGYVGSWKGAGSAKGDAAKGSWSEESEWTWEFSGGRAALAFSSPNGKYFSAGRLEPGEKEGTFNFNGTLPDKKTVQKFSGAIDKEGDLVLTDSSSANDRPARVTLSLVAKGKRIIMTYQKKAGPDRFMPVGEVGMTLKGSGFGKDADQRECIITGGAGTITVSYKGQTYYVCCGGCKTSFLEDPEKELAAYKKRKEEEKAAEKAK